MADEYRGSGCGTVFLAFVMGAAIGGGLALLTAPRSGQETRDKVKQLGDDVRDKIKAIADEAEARIQTVIEEGRETLVEKRDTLKSVVEAGREAMEAEQAKHKKPA